MLQERKSGATLYNLLLSSCSAVATKAHTRLFKIVPLSRQLVVAHQHHSAGDSFVPVVYEEIPGKEFDGSDLPFVNRKEDVLRDQRWLAAFEDDTALLEEYVDRVFADPCCLDERMGFWVGTNPAQDELRPLLFYCWYGGASCAITGSLRVKGSFVRRRRIS